MSNTETAIRINRARALELLEAVVAETGEDFTYGLPGDDKSCLYAYDGAPSCMVGRALYKAGVTVDQLSDLDSHDDTGIYELHAGGYEEDESYLGQDANVVLTEGALDVFALAQLQQDFGHKYGEVIESARKASPEKE